MHVCSLVIIYYIKVIKVYSYIYNKKIAMCLTRKLGSIYKVHKKISLRSTSRCCKHVK